MSSGRSGWSIRRPPPRAGRSTSCARYAEAERAWRPLVERDASNEEAQYCLGLVRAGDSRWPRRSHPWNSCSTQATDPARVAQARAALAICYARAERLKDAKATYAAFADSHPPAELADATTYWLAEAVLPADPAWAGRLFESLAEEGAASDYAARALAGLAWSQLQAVRRGRLGGQFRSLAEDVSRRPAGARGGAGPRPGAGDARPGRSGAGDV